MKTMTVKKTSANTKALLLPLSYEELVKALRGRSKAAKESAIKRKNSLEDRIAKQTKAPKEYDLTK